MTSLNQQQRRKILILIFSLVICGTLNACNPSAGVHKPDSTEPINTNTVTPAEIGSCGLDLPKDIDDERAIAATLEAEGSFVVQQNTAALLRLWATDGRIFDAKHTPNNLEDDQSWQGIDAIRHRYIRWVFPGAPAMVHPADLVISIIDKKAIVAGTTKIGNEVSPAGDRWQLMQIEGCWVIQELIFNLEPLSLK